MKKAKWYLERMIAANEKEPIVTINGYDIGDQFSKL